MPAPSAVKICTENAAARVRGDAGDGILLVGLVHLAGSAIRNRRDLHIRALRRSAAQIRGKSNMLTRA